MISDEIYDSSMFFTGRLIGLSFVTAAFSILVRDVGWYFLNLPTRDQTKTTQRCYDWFEGKVNHISHRE